MSIIQNLISVDGESIAIVLLIILLSLLLKYFCNIFRKDPRLVRFAKTLPGPPTVPIFGNSLDMYDKSSIERLTEYFDKYGDIYRLWWGKHLVIGISKVNDLEVIFMNSRLLAKSELFQPYREFWGNSIFTAPVHIWKKTRKRLQPVFGNNRLGTYAQQFNDKINHCINILKRFADGPKFDIQSYMSHLSFDIITKTTFDMQFDWEDKLAVNYHESANKAMQMGYFAFFSPWSQNKCLRTGNLFYIRKRKQILNDMLKLGRKIIDHKSNENKTEIFADNYEDNSMKTFFTIARELKEEMNDESYLYDEVVNILAAGTNTTSTQICYLLLALAIHQHIQEKLYNEIYALFGNSEREPDQDDLKRLPYLDQVVKEALRRFTLIPFILRSVEEDTKIGDRIIPAGTVLLVSIAGVHYNPKYYPNPWNFNPDNFSAENAEKRPKFAFIPFSAGSRNCIGQNYALLEMKLATIAFLKNFSWHTTMKMEDIKLSTGFSVSSVNGYNVTIKLRKTT